MGTEPAEIRMMAEAISTDAPPFEAFFAAEWARLFRSILLLTGSKQEAEDLAQIAFLKLYERWDSIEHDRAEGYLFKTALNAQRSLYRRARLAATRTLAPGRADEDPFELIARHDEAVRRLLELTPRQRAAIVLTGIEGFDYHEAAIVLGIKESTVRALVSQARARLTEGDRDDD